MSVVVVTEEKVAAVRSYHIGLHEINKSIPAKIPKIEACEDYAYEPEIIKHNFRSPSWLLNRRYLFPVHSYWTRIIPRPSQTLLTPHE